MGTFKERNPRALRFRVVTLDKERKVWIVKKSGLTKQEAEETCKRYFAIGVTARLIVND